jgi:hypothetical protein
MRSAGGWEWACGQQLDLYNANTSTCWIPCAREPRALRSCQLPSELYAWLIKNWETERKSRARAVVLSECSQIERALPDQRKYHLSEIAKLPMALHPLEDDMDKAPDSRRGPQMNRMVACVKEILSISLWKGAPMYKFITNHYDPAKSAEALLKKRVLYEPATAWSLRPPPLAEFQASCTSCFQTATLTRTTSAASGILVAEDFDEWSEPMTLIGDWPGEKKVNSF